MSLADFWKALDAKIEAETAELRKKRPDLKIDGTLKPDRARTLRAKARIANGYHPSGVRLREPPGETCGTCAFFRVKKYGGTYFKCSLQKDTKGPGTDIRKSWPACAQWKVAP
jgi:hypothetical protein